MNLLQPKKLKYKKYHKKLSSFTIKNYSKKELDFGTFGLKVMEHSRISARQIEAMRKIIRRITKRAGILWIKAFPHLPVTSKPSEIRMGKGKGTVAYWAAFVKKYSILIELSGISTQIAYKALQNAAVKLPFKTQVIKQKR